MAADASIGRGKDPFSKDFVANVMTALVEAKRLAAVVGQGEFRCPHCKTGLIKFKVIHNRKKSTAGQCSTKDCISWIE